MQIVSPRLRALHDYWQHKRGSRPYPARADIDPLDLPDLLPTLLLLDVESGGSLRLRVRLVGTEVVDNYGADYTGQYLDDIDFGVQRARIVADYAECALTGEPNVNQRTFRNPRGVSVQMERLVLPLASDGETVDMLLAGIAFATSAAAR